MRKKNSCAEEYYGSNVVQWWVGTIIRLFFLALLVAVLDKLE